MNHAEFMRRAIRLSCTAATSGGGPFGAVVVQEGRIIGEGVNSVVSSGDPTAHAEIVAIRAACRTIGNFSLAGATLYTSCEPCPMCLGAIWWARVGAVYYGNSRSEAARIGFDDEALYCEVAAPLAERRLPLHRLMAAEALEAFALWRDNPEKVPY